MEPTNLSAHQHTITSEVSHRIWITDGILYNEYVGEITLSAVLENESKSMDLLNEHEIAVLPMIVIFKNIDKTTFKLNIVDYAKVITAFDLSKRVSGAWIVGMSPEVRKLVDVVNKIFFSGRMRFVDQLSDAVKQAELFKDSTKTLLEK